MKPEEKQFWCKIGADVKKHRKLSKISQGTLAKKLGLKTKISISYIEQGAHKISLYRWKRIREILNF